MSSKDTIHNLWRHSVVRFACVGVINTCIDLTILNILVFKLGLRPLVANLISASISIIISYFLNHTIVFQRQHAITLKLFLKFIVVTGLSILAVQSIVIFVVIHLLTLNFLQSVLQGGPLASKAKLIQLNCAKLLAVIVGMAWNFTLYHLVVFRKEEAIQDEGVVPY